MCALTKLLRVFDQSENDFSAGLEDLMGGFAIFDNFHAGVDQRSVFQESHAHVLSSGING